MIGNYRSGSVIGMRSEARVEIVVRGILRMCWWERLKSRCEWADSNEAPYTIVGVENEENGVITEEQKGVIAIVERVLDEEHASKRRV